MHLASMAEQGSGNWRVDASLSPCRDRQWEGLVDRLSQKRTCRPTARGELNDLCWKKEKEDDTRL